MENQTEQKEVKTTKKSNLPFTLFACLATAFIVVLATNIGRNLEKVVAPETNTNNVTEKECNCKEENTTTETNSNSNTTTETNSNSNTTTETNCNSNTTTKAVYTEKVLVGHYMVSVTTKEKNENNEPITTKTVLSLYSNGMYSFGVDSNIPGCGYGTDGNFYVIDNQIILNPIFMNHCEDAMATDEPKINGIIKSNSEITLNYNSKQVTLKKVTDSETLKKFTNEKDFIKGITDNVQYMQ